MMTNYIALIRVWYVEIYSTYMYIPRQKFNQSVRNSYIEIGKAEESISQAWEILQLTVEYRFKTYQTSTETQSFTLYSIYR